MLLGDPSKKAFRVVDIQEMIPGPLSIIEVDITNVSSTVVVVVVRRRQPSKRAVVMMPRSKMPVGCLPKLTVDDLQQRNHNVHQFNVMW